MKNKIMEIIRPFKKAIFILLVFLVLYIIVGVIIPSINEANANKTPIVSITGTNKRIYEVDEEIKKEDFDIEAIHESGKKSSVDEDEFDISRKSIEPIGNTTTITITLKSNKDITCDIKVKSEREKMVGFQCGYPNVKSVKAVVYSNGELCFEGTGDTLVFEDGDFPWLDYNDVDIKAVSFQDTVAPTNMNYWFENLETLEYVDSIPASVKTMVKTFSECENLTTMADMSNCTELLNISEAYADCSSLVKTKPIPACVTTAISTFEDCVELQSTPDMSGALLLSNADSMYKGCVKLTNIIMAPAIKDLSNTFEDCINLKNMPSIPSYVENMNSTFKGNISLTNLTEIPPKVVDTTYCFAECEMISGNLIVSANPENFSGMFDGAAVATKVNLTGMSKLLDPMANTTENGNVLVNNKPANPELKGYNDVFDNM